MNYFNEEKNKKFYDYINQKGLSSLNVYDNNPSYDLTFLYYQMAILGFYLLIKFFCSFLYVFAKVEKKKGKNINKKHNNLLDINYNNYNNSFDFDENENDDYNFKKSFNNNRSLYSEEYTEIFYNPENKKNNNNQNNYNNINSFESSYTNNGNNNNNTITPTKFQKIFIFLYDFFSYKTNFFHLTSGNGNGNFVKNIYYNDKNMENFTYIKNILLFFITYSQIFYASIILPHRDFFIIKNFKKFFFGVFKISYMAIDCYVALEALIFTYKLMNYIKKNGENFKTFLKFYFFSIPKILSFLFFYFFIGIKFREYGSILSNNFIFNRGLIDKFGQKACFNENPFLIFNFFWYIYIDESNSESYTKCLKFVYIYINMFLCFNIFLFIFYISLKFKNKKFDIIITGIFFVLFLTAFLNFDLDSMENNLLTLSRIMGELLSMKYLHLFIIKYFLGVLGGLFFFYSNETVLINSYITGNNKYLPFEFVYKFLVYINSNIRKNNKKNKNKENKEIKEKKVSQIYNSNNNINIDSNKNDNNIENKNSLIYTSDDLNTENNIICTDNNNNSKTMNLNLNQNLKRSNKSNRKIIFILLSFLIEFFICFYFLIKLWIFADNSDLGILNFTFELQFFYFYEKYIFVAMFILQLMIFSLLKSIDFMKAIKQSSNLFFIGRINFPVFCGIDYIVFIFLSQYDNEFFFSYANVFFLTLGIFSILLIFGFIFTYLVELPFRKLVKIFIK
jgi:hypothetical protein